MLNKRDRLNYEDIWQTLEAAVPTFESRAPWLSISKVKPRFAYRCLSLPLPSRINHRAATPSFSLFPSAPRLILQRSTTHVQPRHTPPPQKISFSSGRNLGKSRRFLFCSLTTSLMNVNVRRHEFCDSGATAMYGRHCPRYYSALSYRQL